MTWGDHALAAALVVVSPPATAWSAARLARRLAAGDAGARLRYYAWSVAEGWALTAALLALWRWTGRPPEALGIVAPSGAAAWITAGLCAATVLLFAVQVRTVRSSAEARASVRAQLERASGVRAVVPASAAELRGFVAVALTAGICEELLFRGFVLWYLGALLPAGWALAATAAVFGLAHAYQGLRGVLLTGLVGAVALAIYLWTGSLLAPIVMHAVVDLANGWIACRARAGDVWPPRPHAPTASPAGGSRPHSRSR